MKKQHLIFSILMAAAAQMGISSCSISCKQGSGKLVTETRPVSGFSEIAVEGAYRVVVKQDTGYAVKITGDDNLLEYVETEVSGNQLYIRNRHGLCPSGELVVNVGMHDLSLIKCSGAVNVESDGKLSAKDIKFDLSGTTKMNLNLNADNVDTESSGIAAIALTGQAASHTVNFSGSGTLNALDFVVAKYKIESSGASNCKINVLSSLKVNSSGVSNVEYKGNPASVESSKSGSATVSKIN